MVVLDHIRNADTSSTFVSNYPSNQLSASESRGFSRSWIRPVDLHSSIASMQFRPTGTTGTADFYKQYSPNLPSSTAIFDDVKERMRNMPQSPQKAMMHEILLALENCINGHLRELRFVPKSTLTLTELDDKTLLLEWSYKNIRILFSVENDIECSSFCALTADSGGKIMSFVDDLRYDNIDECVNTAVKIVASHL